MWFQNQLVITMEKIFFIIFVLISGCEGVIFKLNDSQYPRMPPVFHLDDYHNCITDPDGVYCAVDVDIVSDTQSALYDLMRNYSDYTRKHFNHTQLHHGICLTRTCKNYLQEPTGDPKVTLERCLNESLWENYQLKCRISQPIFCNNDEDKVYDGEDIAMGVFLLIIFGLNIMASLYEVIFVKRRNKPGNGLLLCFSIPRNFSRLITSYGNLEPREERLKSFHGLRTMTIMCVIFCHSLLPFALGPENTRYAEMLYDNILHFIFLNGTIVVQTFFIISGCLLSYKLEIYAEKHDINWSLLPKAVIMLWVKLTPSYAIVLALTCTWLRHAGWGPFWEVAVTREINDCRRNGWANLLYVNNYLDDTQCMVQSWYLGAIMQLYILGYLICVLTKGKLRKGIIILFFIIGIGTPAAHTYLQDLDAVLMVTPETARTFMKNPTFNYVYKRGHTNIVNFILGIALGFLVYDLQLKKVDMQKYQKYRFLFLLTLPAFLGCIFVGSVFYVDDFIYSIYSKSLYAGLIKPLYGVIIAALIIGSVFKIDNVYRPILEWNGWKVPSRISYCAYLFHMVLIRVATGTGTTLTPVNTLRMTETAVAFIVMSFLAAFPMWLLIDAPITGFLNKIFTIILCQRNKAEQSIPIRNTSLPKKDHQTTLELEQENGAL